MMRERRFSYMGGYHPCSYTKAINMKLLKYVFYFHGYHSGYHKRLHILVKYFMHQIGLLII